MRALRVLSALSTARQGLTLKELADELAVPVGSLHRLLAVLSAERFLARSSTNRRYFLGPAARALFEGSRTPAAMLSAPHPALAAAAKRSGETVFLTELAGETAVCVALVEGRHPLRLFVRVGQEMPLHAAASARVLLADLDDEQVLRLLSARSLTAYTEETPTTVDDVMSHVAWVRTRGYDVCDDELDLHVWAVSVPVLMSTDRVCASVTVAAPANRLAGASARQSALEAVLDAAAAMSADVGYGGDRFTRISREAVPGGPQTIAVASARPHILAGAHGVDRRGRTP